MTRSVRLALAAGLIAITAAASPVAAQNTAPKPVKTPMKVDIVLSRYQGDKKLSSMPFTLLVNATAEKPDETTSLRVGMNVPVGQTSSTSAQGVTTSRQDVRWIGTEIDCRVERPGDDARYRTWLQVADSSLYANNNTADPNGPTGGVGVSMAFRSFSVSNTLLLRENQTLQFSVGTDRLTGETVKADVTLSMLK